MPATLTRPRETALAQSPSAGAATPAPERAPSLPSRGAQARRPAPDFPRRAATDDEILGLVSPAETDARDPQLAFDFEPANGDAEAPHAAESAAPAPGAEDAGAAPENLRAAFEANPELRRAWQDAQSYRETFATPEEARAATALLADLDRMDALFFSRRPEDHAELARAVAHLDPGAFASLAQEMNALANGRIAGTASVGPHVAHPGSAGVRTFATSQAAGQSGQGLGSEDPSYITAHRTLPVISNAPTQSGTEDSAFRARDTETQSQRGAQLAARADLGVAPGPSTRHAAPSATDAALKTAALHSNPEQATPAEGVTPAQAEFFHATNAAAVQGVLDAIETQVERLLPEGIARSGRNRVVGEIYRELDATLRSNRQLAQQMREAFRSGALDAEHQRAVVSLVTGRARQALPGVAKRVLNEWTSTIVTANQDRRARQRAAERRVDIAGSSGAGNDGQRAMTPRDINYARLSDADILNL